MPTKDSQAFQQFYQAVLDDPALLERLRAASDESALTLLAVELGRERGFAFDAAEVSARFRMARRAWNERWVR